MEKAKLITLTERKEDYNLSELKNLIRDKKFGYHRKPGNYDYDYEFLFRYNDEIYTQDFSLIDLWNDELKEKYLISEQELKLMSIMIAYKMNFFDALFITFLCNKKLNPDINLNILHDELLQGANKIHHPVYSDTYRYERNKEDYIINHFTMYLKRSDLRRNNKVPFKYIENSIFMDVLNTEKLVVRDYNDLLTYFDGGLSSSWFSLIDSQMSLFVPNNQDKVIDFKDNKINISLNSGYVNKKFYDVVVDLTEEWNYVEIRENELEADALKLILNNLPLIYTEYKKMVTPDKVDEDLIRDICRVVDRAIHHKFRDVSLGLHISLDLPDKYTPLKDVFYTALSNAGVKNVKIMEFRHNLLLVDKIYNIAINSKTDVIREILSANITDYLFPKLINKDIYKKYKDEFYQRSIAVFDKYIDDYIKYSNQNDESDINSKYYYDRYSQSSFYIYCSAYEAKKEIKESFKQKITEIAVDINYNIIEEHFQQEEKTKINQLLLGVNKSQWKLLLSKDKFIVGNYLKLFNSGLESIIENEHDFNVIVNHPFLEYNITPLLERVNYDNSYVPAVVLLRKVRDSFTLNESLKVLTYIVDDCKDRQGIVEGAVTIYNDYFTMYQYTVTEGFNTQESFNLYPYSLKLAHDTTLLDYNAINKDIESASFKLIYDELKELNNKTLVRATKSQPSIRLYLPEHPDDIRDEGKSLSHCVASYVRKVLNKECYILFAREADHPDKSLYTIELKRVIDGRYVLGQTKGMHNKEMGDAKRLQMKRIIDKYLHNKDIEEELLIDG